MFARSPETQLMPGLFEKLQNNLIAILRIVDRKLRRFDAQEISADRAENRSI